MLPLGYLGPFPGDGRARDTRLTHDEQRTMITLWSIARSPLILGANLTRVDPWTLSLLTNPGVIAMDQRGHNQKQVKHEGDLIAWTSDGKPGQHYLALFNIGDQELDFNLPYDTFGLPKRQFEARDLWTGAPVEIGIGSEARGLRETLPPHGCVLLELQER